MDKPPSDIDDYAIDFARRYVENLDIVVGQVMMDLNLTKDQLGAFDPYRPGEHHSFHPEDRTGGSVSHAGQVTIDSGILNPYLSDQGFDEETQKVWRKTKLRSRTEAISVHELAEHEYKDHELAF